MRDEFEQLQQDPEYRANSRNLPLLVLICYILYSIKEYDCIIPLIYDLKDIDMYFLAHSRYGIKFITYWQMKRYDYMQKTFEEIKEFSEDASLTQLMQCFLMLCTGNLQELTNMLKETMLRYDKSIKLYNLIGMARMARGQAGAAVKMYSKAVDEFKLKDADKFVGNADVTDFIYNYLLALKWAEPADSPQIAEVSAILDSLEDTDQSGAVQEFEAKFDEACKKVFG